MSDQPTRDDPDYLWDRSGEDPEVARLEQLLGGYAHDAPLREPPPPRRRSRRTAFIAASVAVVAIAAVLLVLWSRRPEQTQVAAGAPGFAFQVTGGAASANGILRVGAWLETEPGVTADVQVADIGDVRLEPSSRLRLLATGPDEHRLELQRGKLSARVTAPPRLFIIDTPVAVAVDLGCAYDMAVDEAGKTHVRVTSGAISLEGHGRMAWIPWGHEATAERGIGPGTPVRSDASPAYRAAVARFDAGEVGGWGGEPPLATIVDESGPADAVTLWNLLSRTEGADRVAVFSRLDEVAIRPEWVLEEDVLSLQPDALERWRESLEGTWILGP